jgi:GT2 family glycosyltransferase
MAERICAVVVTFNRRDLLLGCLRSLARQTRALDDIVVVNNASTDGTSEMLATQFPDVVALHLATNIGGAGGFHKGMEWAYERGCDWMWVMDDDVEVLPEALCVMLGYQNLSDFIHARRVTDNVAYCWEGMWDVTAAVKKSLSEELSFRNGKKWTSVTYGNFEGALIHRRVIDRIGLPDPRFFVHGDDLIYGCLASFHTNVIYIDHIGLRRMAPPASSGHRRFYFLFRNRFLTLQYLRSLGVPISRVVFWVDIIVAAVWYLRQPRVRGEASRWRSLRAMLSGVRDGVCERFGPPPWLRGRSSAR